MGTETVEPIAVGDILPHVLDQARKQGEARGRQRSVRKSTVDPYQYRRREGRGRPSRLYPALRDEIAQRIEDGCPVEAAAVSVGICASTFHNWMKRGRDARAIIDGGGNLDPRELIYLDFMETCEGARASSMARAVTAHQRLAFGGEVSEIHERFDKDGETVVGRTLVFTKPDRGALEWYLERGFPHQWGTRRLEISGEDGGPIPIEVEVSARDILRKRLEQVAVRLGEEQEASAS